MASFSFLAIWVSLLLFASKFAFADTTPPRGWNSYDSYLWYINETQFLQNAEYQAANLLKYGYEYVTVDYLWYVDVNNPTVTIVDEYGRPQPDPKRWPSSANGNGFKMVANKLHQLGLKFGIHVLRGISIDAITKNTMIKNSPYTTGTIGTKGGNCNWEPQFLSVNLSAPGGYAFINSLYEQFAEWGVDFVKNDCIFGYDLVNDEILAVSKAITQTQRNIVYSLSPGGGATTDMANKINNYVDMYRITGDNWDNWNDLYSHFDTARDFAAASLIGAPGKVDQSWPDLDMLPFGFINILGSNNTTPTHYSYLTKNEQITEMTLWSIAKSPLIHGGDMTHMDNFTLSLLTNPYILDLNSFSQGNAEMILNPTINNVRVWTAQTGPKQSQKGIYVAIFNTGDQVINSVQISFSDIGLANTAQCSTKELWTNIGTVQKGMLAISSLPIHGTQIFLLTSCQ